MNFSTILDNSKKYIIWLKVSDDNTSSVIEWELDTVLVCIDTKITNTYFSLEGKSTCRYTFIQQSMSGKDFGNTNDLDCDFIRILFQTII